jgi:hypothetical protein
VPILSSLLLSASLAPVVLGATANPCEPGETWLQPTAVEKQSDGGQLDDYWIDGLLNQVAVPPRNFQPLTASDEALAMYGFPARPAAEDALAAWTDDLANWKPTPDLGLCQTTMRATVVQASNWSGYYATVSSNLYIAAQGDYHQPTAGSTSCTSPQEVSWVGVGGVYSNALIQDGTGISTSGGYYAWYEYLNTSGGGISITKLPSVTVHAGDRMHSYTVHQTSGVGQTTFYVADNTTSTSQSVIVNLSSSYYDGRTAEWIDERPLVNGSNSPLRNFGTVNWTNTQAQRANSTWYTLGSQPYVEVDMMDNTFSHYLAFPNSLSSNTTFTDNWFRCS